MLQIVFLLLPRKHISGSFRVGVLPSLPDTKVQRYKGLASEAKVLHYVIQYRTQAT